VNGERAVVLIVVWLTLAGFRSCAARILDRRLDLLFWLQA
jgi:hypothetical protein